MHWLTLAQRQTAGKAMELWVWVVILAVIVCIGAIVLWWLRKRLMDQGGGSGGLPAFTLEDLRRMHASGQISDAEFDRARTRMLGRMGAVSASDAADSGPQSDLSADADPGSRRPDPPRRPDGSGDRPKPEP